MFTNVRETITRAFDFTDILKTLPRTRCDIWMDALGRINCKNKTVAVLVKKLLENVFEESVSMSGENGISIVHALDEDSEYSSGNFKPLTMEEIADKLPTTPGDIWLNDDAFGRYICCKSDKVADFLQHMISFIEDKDFSVFFDGEYWNIPLDDGED